MEYKPINNISLDYNNTIVGAITNWNTSNNINITINITMKTTPNFYIDLVDTNNINIYYLRITQNNYTKTQNTYNLQLSNINKNSVNSLNYINKLNTTNNNNFNVKITPIIEQDITSNKYKPLLIDSININIIKSNNLLTQDTNNININNKIQNGLQSSIMVSENQVQNTQSSVRQLGEESASTQSCKAKKRKNFIIKDKIYKIDNIFYILFLIICAVFGFLNGISIYSDANTRYYDYIKNNNLYIIQKPQTEITDDEETDDKIKKLIIEKLGIENKIKELRNNIELLNKTKKTEQMHDIYSKLTDAKLKKDIYIKHLNEVSESIFKLQKEIKDKKN